jgi:hypothetical protein
MPVEQRPVGGTIEVQSDGSVLWSVRDRYFPRQRDADGAIEYAIRVASVDRGVFGSSDGKCLLTVAFPTQSQHAGHRTFLIASGYASRAAPADYCIVGKEYFITADHHRTEEMDKNHELLIPLYDLTLRFDEYDLEYAGLAHEEAEKLDLSDERLDAYRLNWAKARELLGLPTINGSEMLPDIRGRIHQGRLGRLPQISATEDYPPLTVTDADKKMLEWKFGAPMTDIENLRLRLWNDKADAWVLWWDPIVKAGTDSDSGEQPKIAARIAGSRALTIRNLQDAGTYALMYQMSIKDDPNRQP